MTTRSRIATGALSLVVLGGLANAAGPEAQTRLKAHDAQIKALIAQMTLDEKIGQMTQAEAGKDFIGHEQDIETYFLGSMLSGGSADPKTNSLEDWTDMVDGLQAHALKTRLKIPILYGIDAVHGHANVIGAVVFPHNVGLGATRDAKLVEEIAQITAAEVRATGIQWAFSPCVTVPRDVRWGRSYEGYSEDPKLVAVLGRAAVLGYQGRDLADPLRVLACAKHFAGDGGTTWQSGEFSQNARRAPLDQGDTRLDEATLRKLHMQGYLTAIEAGVGSIMPSYNSWNGEKVSGSRRLLTEILKQELGFEGFLISDYNALDQLPGDRRAQTKLSINAGMDMVMAPGEYKDFIITLKSLVEGGEVEVTRIDDAVTRILRAKYALGLFDRGRSPLADRGLHAEFGSKAHRAVARRAVAESLVLLKNDKKALPLSKIAKRIHVGGKNADDLGHQCGGWTIDWQGKSGALTDGTTILAALRQAAPKASITFSRDGSGAEGADVAVIVVGETPYAEGRGDREDLSLDAADQEAIANAKKAGVPVVLVVVSGRPMVLGDAASDAAAIVAAWLPGTEGAGVADVLFGDFKPTGKLPFTWPRSMAQILMRAGDKTYDPLYAYGHGLSY